MRVIRLFLDMRSELRHLSKPALAGRLAVITALVAYLGLQITFSAWSLFTVGGRTPFLVGACTDYWGGGCDSAPPGDWLDLLGVRAHRGLRFVEVDSLGALGQAGLRPGDVLVRLDGKNVYDHPGAYFEMLIRGQPGQAAELVYVREGIEHTGTLVLPEERLNRTVHAAAGGIFRPLYSAAAENWLEYGPLLLFHFLVFVLGGLVGFLRVRDRIAFLFAATMLSLGASSLLFNLPLIASWPLAVHTVVAIGEFSLLCLALVLIPLFAVFPSQSRFGRFMLRWRWLVGVVYAIWACGRVANGLASLYPGLSRWSWLWRPDVIDWTSDLPFFVLVAMIGSLLIAQRIEVRGAPSRRFRTVQSGLALMTACGLLWFATNVLPLSAGGVHAIAVGNYAQILSLLLLPVAIAMVAHGVIANRMFSLRFVVRRGLQHLLLSRGVLAGEFVLLFFLLLQVLRGARFDFSESVPAVAGLSLTSSVLVVIGLRRVNRPLMEAIDRRFFRDAYDGRRVLVGLGQLLAGRMEPRTILERAGTALIVALHPVRAAWYLGAARDSMRLEWEHRQNVAGRRPATNAEAATTEPAKGDADRIGEALEQFDSGRSWVEYPPRREEADAPLDLARPAPFELVIPVRAGDELIGCLALSVKLSGEPFSGEDRDLLLTVARQLGMALENAKLVEVAKREAQHTKELEIARGVQQNLFPKNLPARDGWQFAAMCRPARAVGGDYYDLFEIDSTHVALALGDVSGKGLGPALMMSSIHAMARSGLPPLATAPSRFVESLNEHLVNSTSVEMFATLFVGVLDTSSGRLRYVNAGHNPPIVSREGSAEVSTLTGGDLIVGALPGVKYNDADHHIGNGDLLVIFSDGITEAMNAAGEMFEEEKLREVVVRARESGKATEVLSAIIEAVDRFAGGAEQADDMSVVVVMRGVTAFSSETG